MIGNAAVRPRYIYRIIALLDYTAAKVVGRDPGLWDYKTNDPESPYAQDEPGVRWALLDAQNQVIQTNHPLWTPRIGLTIDFRYFN